MNKLGLEAASVGNHEFDEGYQELLRMQEGGCQADLSFARSGPELTDGIVQFEEAFTVQPFNNYLASMDLTGAHIWGLLKQQWSGRNAGSSNTKFLQVSNGLHYTWTGVAPAQFVTAVTINGAPVANDGSTSYRIVTLSDGGDDFPAFRTGTDKYFGGLDIDGLAKYLPTVSQYSPLPLNRITKQ